MRVVFTVIPEKGHLNPYIPVAQSLQRAGHTIAFFSGADIRGQLSAAGLPIFLGQPHKTEPPSASRGRTFAEQIKSPLLLRHWIKSLLVDSVPGEIEPLRSLLKDFAPDIVVTDPMLYQSVIVSEQEDIPWVSASNSLNPALHSGIESELLRTVEWLSPSREELFSAYGLKDIKFKGCDTISPYLTTCFSTQEFIGSLVEGVHLTGPSMPHHHRGDETDFAWSLLNKNKKKIYMSFGSQIYYQPEYFKKVIEAIGPMPGVQLILSVNELASTQDLGTIPDHVIVVHYTPQVKLLKHIDLFITHGGANSVMEALSVGVPMLISPLCNDQFHQAWFIKNSGVGKEIDLDIMDAGQIRGCIEAIFEDQSVQKNMLRVHESYQVDGAAVAAQLIEEITA